MSEHLNKLAKIEDQVDITKFLEQSQFANQHSFHSVSCAEQIKQIFSQSSLTEFEKADMINKLNNQFENFIIHNWDKSRLQLNGDLCKTINSHLKGLKSNSELALLNLIELVLLRHCRNQYIEPVQNSELLEKIKYFLREIILIDRNEGQYNDEFYSEVNIQLNGFVSNQQENLLEQFHKIMKLGIQTLDLIANQGWEAFKRDYFVHEMKIHEFVAHLLHINCPSILSCPHRIEVITYNEIHQFQVAVINTLAQYERDASVQKYLSQEHKIIEHFTMTVVQLANFDNKNNNHFEKYPHSSLFQHPQVVNAALDHLGELIYNKINILKDNPELIPSVMKLAKFNRKTSQIINYEDTILVRINSYQLLDRLLSSDYKEAYIQQLIHDLIDNFNFISSAIDAIGCCSGSTEDDDRTIFCAIFCIVHLLWSMDCYDEQNHQTQDMITVIEQIEAEGGNEEIGVCLHRIENCYEQCTTQMLAYDLKNQLINMFYDPSSRIDYYI